MSKMKRELCGYCDAGLAMACTCPKSKRLIKREEVNRHGVDSMGRYFLICKSWHFLDDGVTKFCYIHVYRNVSSIPFRWWRWIEHPDGRWEWAP